MAYLVSDMIYKPSKSEWPWPWPFKVTKVRSNHTNGLPIYASLLMFNCDLCYNLTLLLCEIYGFEIWAKSDLNLSRLLKVKSDDVVGLPVCNFLLVSNNSTSPNSAPLRDISLWNASDPDIGLSRSLKSNVITPTDSPYTHSYYV